jgi:hypothetical protein
MSCVLGQVRSTRSVSAERTVKTNRLQGSLKNIPPHVLSVGPSVSVRVCPREIVRRVGFLETGMMLKSAVGVCARWNRFGSPS